MRQGREVSYSSILNRSVSTRRQNLYVNRGLDIERWADLVTDKKAIQKEIDRIREDYEAGWKEGNQAKLNKPAEDGDEEEIVASELHPSSNKDDSGAGLSGEEQSQAALDKELLKSRKESRPQGERTVVENRREEISQEDEKERSRKE